MEPIAIIAFLFAVVFLCGLFGFGMMFGDINPSQETYLWPYALGIGAAGLILCGIAAVVTWYTA